jgi:poly(3-hydroxybutyrate) depolymerase
MTLQFVIEIERIGLIVVSDQHFTDELNKGANMKFNAIFKLFLVIALSIFTAQSLAQGSQLPALSSYGAQGDQISVSGISSGAFMAVQFQTAYSDVVTGAGVIAGGPPLCASSFPFIPNSQAAVTLCMAPLGRTGPNPKEILSKVNELASKGSIASLKNFEHARIYAFSGTQDHVVKQSVVDVTVRFFELAGVKPGNIKYVNNLAAGHAILTDSPLDTPCGTTREPFINNCGYKQAFELLDWINGGTLHKPSSTPLGTLHAFDQKTFDPQGGAMLGPVGYVYVPQACENESCRIHVAFHGCYQNHTKLGNRFASGAGYNEVADTNNFIVLYPQVGESPRNPLGCWDFWGYSDQTNANNPDFYSRNAPQMAAVKRMIDQLTARR